MILSEDNLGLRMLVDEVELRAAISDLMGAQDQAQRAKLASQIRGLGRLIGDYAVQYAQASRKPVAVARTMQASRAG